MEPSKAHYRKCEKPFGLRCQSVSTSTGEIFSDKIVEKRCGNRRRDICEPCSEIWRDDAYFAILNGAEKYQGVITFFTFTAPGWKTFGRTHTAAYSGKKSERCLCRKFHAIGDETVGLPLNNEDFHYDKVAQFNQDAPRLTAITLQKIFRLWAKQENKSVKDTRVPVMRVMEWQARGVLHVHLIALGEIPQDVIKDAVNGRTGKNGHRFVEASKHNRTRWGNQVDIKYVNSGDPSQTKKLSSYVTKVVGYALKDVALAENLTTKGHEAMRHKIRVETGSSVKCSKSWAECGVAGQNSLREVEAKIARLEAMNHSQNQIRKVLVKLEELYREQKILSTLVLKDTRDRNGNYPICRKHKRARHQLGFTGNVLSLNRKWGTSLGEAKRRRIEYAKSRYFDGKQNASAFCLDIEKKFITHVQFLGRKNLLDGSYAFMKIAHTVDKGAALAPANH